MATKCLSKHGLDTLVAQILAELTKYVATSEYNENVEALNQTLLQMVSDIENKADSNHAHEGYITETMALELIKTYMTENYENGDEGSY